MKNIKQKQMRIEDNGFIVFVKKFEENSLLVRILSKENGLISGYVKHTKKDINQYFRNNDTISEIIKFYNALSDEKVV